MKAFDTNYQLLAEMYRDDYFPVFLVDKIKNELQKVIDLLESGEKKTPKSFRKPWTRKSVESMTFKRHLTRMTARLRQSLEKVSPKLWPTFLNGSTSRSIQRKPSGNETGDVDGV